MSIRLTESRLRQIIREEIKGMGRRARLRESGGDWSADEDYAKVMSKPWDGQRYWKTLGEMKANSDKNSEESWAYDGFRDAMNLAMEELGIPEPSWSEILSRNTTPWSKEGMDNARKELNDAYIQIYEENMEDLEAVHNERWMKQAKKTEDDKMASIKRHSEIEAAGGLYAGVRGTPAEKAALRKVAKWFSVYGWYKYQSSPGSVGKTDSYHAADTEFDLPASLGDVVSIGTANDIIVDGEAVLLMKRLGVDITPFTSLPDEENWDERMSYGEEYQDELGGYVKNKFLKRRDSSGMAVKTRIR